jgi:hypothetical protein
MSVSLVPQDLQEFREEILTKNSFCFAGFLAI